MTVHLKGLAAYQKLGWANNPAFPPFKGVDAGFDPIIGQAADPTSRTVLGTDPARQGDSLLLTQQWVLSKGGEYFFTPSLSSLKATFARVA